jgi:hypothetical protein
MWNKPLQTFVIGITMVAGVSLSACDGSKEEAAEEVASEVTTEQTSAESTEPEASKPDADLDGATAQQGVPVSYNVASWSSDEVKSVNINELDSLKSSFGKVASTDENSLDYASNSATKYRFMATDAPYLDLIDSEKYLELGWYYANPTDSDKEKDLSKAHAKKAYMVARQLMGNDGGTVLADMLSGQIIKDKTMGGQKIELAKCEFYSCMLVLNKSGASVAES